MVKRFLLICFGVLLGCSFGLTILFNFPKISREAHLVLPIPLQSQIVIGFLPYWLLDTAKTDYSDTITTLTYFGLQIAPDGSLVKLTDAQSEEPGWYALSSGRLNQFFHSARQHNVSLSLLLSCSGNDAITALINQPVTHAKKLVNTVSPLLKKYNFSDLK